MNKICSLLCVILSLLSHQIVGRQLITIGSEWGGWTIPVDLLNSHSICYCAGAGNDISFDVGIVQRYGCQAYIFDPTPLAIDHFEEFKQRISRGQAFRTGPHNYPYSLDKDLLPHIHFYPIGLWGTNTMLKFFEPQDPTHASYSVLNLQKTTRYFEASCKSLKTIMEENGHTHIDLLKLDIEGAEYSVLDSIFRDNLDIKCICIEFDEVAGLHRLYNTHLKESIQRIQYYIALLQHHGYRLIYAKDYTDMTFLKD